MIKNRPINNYKSFFSEERWNELQYHINNWVPATNEKGQAYKNLYMNVETRYAVYATAKSLKDDSTYEYHQKKVFEQLLTDEELQKCEEYSHEKFRNEYNQRLYENGDKVSYDDYQAPIFDKNGEFFSDLEEYYEHCVYVGIEPEDYWVFGCDMVYIFKESDLETFIGEIEERADMEEPLDVTIPEYLKEAWNRFVSENRDHYFKQNYKIIVELDKKDWEEYIKENE